MKDLKTFSGGTASGDLKHLKINFMGEFTCHWSLISTSPENIRKLAVRSRKRPVA